MDDHTHEQMVEMAKRYNYRLPIRTDTYCEACYGHAVAVLSYKEDMAFLCEEHLALYNTVVTKALE